MQLSRPSDEQASYERIAVVEIVRSIRCDEPMLKVRLRMMMESAEDSQRLV